MAKKQIIEENKETIDEALLDESLEVVEAKKEPIVIEIQAGKYNVKRTQEGSLS